MFTGLRALDSHWSNSNLWISQHETVWQSHHMQLGVWVVSSCTATVSYSCLLGRITNAEMGRVSHRLAKYLIFKAALVGMVVLPEVTLLQWLPWVAFIGQLKMLVSLAKSRLSGLSLTPTAVPSPAARMLLLLQLVLAANGLGFCILVQQLLERSRALVLLLGLDMAATAAEALRAGCSCLALLLDDALATYSISQPEKAQQMPMHPYHSLLSWWEQLQGSSRDRFSYSLELYCDLAVQLVTLLHHTSVWLLHGFSFQLLDALLLLDTKAVVSAILLRIRGHRLHQQMLLNLNSRFPDADVARLEGGESECVICRDRMTAAKQLPCGHVFHIQCLRAWLQQQSSSGSCTCPVCRTSMELPNLSTSSSSRHFEVETVADAAGRSLWAMHNAQQQWQQQQQGSSAGLINTSSSSGSVFDLSVLGSPGSFRGSSSSSSGSVGANRLLRIADRGQQQQQDEEEEEVNWDEGLGLVADRSVDSPDGFEAVLQQALLASLQDQAAGAAATAGNSSSSSSAGSSSSKGDGVCDVGVHAAPSIDYQQQQEKSVAQPANEHSSGSSSSSSSRHQSCNCSPQQLFKAATTQLNKNSSSIAGPSVASSSNGSSTSSSSRIAPVTAVRDNTPYDDSRFEFLERLNSDKFQWSDPLTDSDAASCSDQRPLSAAGRCVSHTCSRVLSAILSPRAILAAAASEPTPPPPAAAAGSRTAGVGTDGDQHRCSSGSSSRGWQALAPWHSSPAAAAAAADGVGDVAASSGKIKPWHSSSTSSSRLDRYAGLTVVVPMEVDQEAAAVTAASYCSSDNRGGLHSRVPSPTGIHVASPLAAAAAAAAVRGSATPPATAAPLDRSHDSSSRTKAAPPAAAAAAAAATRAVADDDDHDECYGTAATYPAAAAALLERITSPRASDRRRDAGRWGRRHWAQQQQQQQQVAAAGMQP